MKIKASRIFNTVIKTNSQAEFTAALTLIESLTGATPANVILPDGYKSGGWECVGLFGTDPNTIHACSVQAANSYRYKIVQFNKMHELIMELSKAIEPAKETVRLNSEYSAVVTSEVVKVGCQNFSVDVITALSAALTKVRKIDEENGLI